MHILNSIKMSSVFGILGMFLACGETDPSRNFSIVVDNANALHANARLDVRLDNKTGAPVDSVRYLLDGLELPAEDGKITLKTTRLGTRNLQALVYTGGQEVQLNKEIVLLADRPPELYTYEVIGEFPHDREAFTQGLEFQGDTLYESTGRKGASTLRKVDYRTGEVLASVSLDSQYFGEGLTILSDTIYMLTWKAGKGLLFDRTSLGQLGSFSYGESKEGWGLCNDGEKLYKSDGTQRIWILDPETLREEEYIETVTDKSVFNKANELEYVKGKLYANVWQKESMMIIDARTGAIEGVVNFGGLKQRVTQHRDLDVFNGVAYHPGRETFFVTGKYWDKLFEVRILKRDEP